ncbi:hypothetical protein [Taklimakanibacter lacteus]|uniref:hypothetical protein n=1 Tax=Taklimakanibacter lacteus TaxID=2268456 RepID=UPI000E669E1F
MAVGLIIGIPWFKRKDWVALKAIFADAHALHDTYEEWRSSVRKVEHRMREEGHLIERIDLEPESFVQWCALRGLRTDAKARASFASEKARERHPD